MLEFDKKSNLLMTNRYQYSLQDVAEPNLYRELYDYESIPKVAFNMRHVPENMPDEIWMTDTTFRDGQQSVSPFTVEQIVHLYSLMHRLGGPKGLIRQSEFFLYTDKDKKALHACQDLGYDFPEITTWIRANEKDFELVKQVGVKETGILVSCSDYHIFKKMHLTRKQAMDKYLGIVKAALDRGIRPRCHFEDITRADFYGFVLPFAEELMYLSEESGLPIKIRACDTMGYGVLLHGEAVCIGMVAAAKWGETLGVTPEGTSARIERVLKAYDLPTERDASLTRAQLAATMALDKKAEGDGVRCVILTEIGACTGVVIESGKLAEML